MECSSGPRGRQGRMTPLLCTLLSTLLWQQTLEEEITSTPPFCGKKCLLVFLSAVWPVWASQYHQESWSVRCRSRRWEGGASTGLFRISLGAGPARQASFLQIRRGILWEAGSAFCSPTDHLQEEGSRATRLLLSQVSFLSEAVECWSDQADREEENSMRRPYM